MVNELWPDANVSYIDQIQSAFEKIIGDMKKIGGAGYVGGLVDFNQLRELLILKTLELIYFGNAGSEESIYWSKYKEIKTEYEDKLNNVTFFYDTDNDGTPDTERKSRVIKMER